MNKYLPRKITDIKGKVALAELQRTHLIVVILVLITITLIIFVSTSIVEINAILIAAVVALLALLGLMSLVTAVGLSRLIKK